LLFRITQYFQPENILEIGTSLGLATAALSLGNPKAKTTTLEGCPETAKIARQQFEKFQLKNIHLETTEFSTYLKKQQPSTNNQQLIYFDGNHSQKATLEYFELLLQIKTLNIHPFYIHQHCQLFKYVSK
jgi:predicted O-methyltransferase YrrM